MTNYISIGELADQTGVSTRTIRYYEERGILPEPTRTDGGTRKYAEEYVFFVEGALALKDLGLSLDEIEALSLWTTHQELSSEQLATAEELVDKKIAQIDHRIRLLEQVKRVFRDRQAVQTPAERRQQLEAATSSQSLSIGDLAEQTGVSTRTIRYYEELGILPAPLRTEGGTRRFTKDFVFYLEAALTLKELGFSLDEIKLLSDWALGRTEDADVIAAAEHLVADKEGELDEKIRLLRKVEDILEARLDEDGHAANGLPGHTFAQFASRSAVEGEKTETV